MLLKRITDWSTSLSIPDSNDAVRISGDDVSPIGRVSNGQDPVSVPLERIADWSTSLGIPDSNGAVVRSGDDVAPIGRVSNRIHPSIMPCKRLPNYCTRLSIPDSNRVVVRSSDNAGPIRRIHHTLDEPNVSSPLNSTGGAGHDDWFPTCTLMALVNSLLKILDKGDCEGRNGCPEI